SDVAGGTSTVTFTFSEATTDFTASDLTVVGGTISGFTGSGTSYSATFTATDDSTATGSVTENGTAHTCTPVTTRAGGSATVTLHPPTPTLVPYTMLCRPSDVAGGTSTVTFTFSEATTDFTASDLTVVGGTISGFTGSGTSYSATFTATDDSTATGSVK